MLFKFFQELLGNLEFDLLLVVSEVKEINLLYFNVEVAEPLIDVTHVLLFDVLKLVELPLDVSVQNRHLEFS